jgi:hypothetical protein
VEACGIANNSTHNRKMVAEFIEAGYEQSGIIMVGRQGFSALKSDEDELVVFFHVRYSLVEV